MRGVIVLGLAGLLLLGAAEAEITAGAAAAADEPTAAQKQLQALKSALETKQKDLIAEFRGAKTEEDRDKIKDRFYGMMAEFLVSVSKVAKENADDPAGKQAVDLMRNTLAQLEQADSPQVAKVLRTLGKQAPKELQGQVALALSQNLRGQYERSYAKKDKEAGKLLKEAEALLKRVAADHPDLAQRAKDVLFELRNLTVGRTAMNIEAEDIDGKKFSLADYRGKVVVIDFWGHW